MPKPKPSKGQKADNITGDAGLRTVHEEEFDDMGNTIGMQETVHVN